jgi:hypothetical protein
VERPVAQARDLAAVIQAEQAELVEIPSWHYTLLAIILFGQLVVQVVWVVRSMLQLAATLDRLGRMVTPLLTWQILLHSSYLALEGQVEERIPLVMLDRTQCWR